jgi:hypothetical protein
MAAVPPPWIESLHDQARHRELMGNLRCGLS